MIRERGASSVVGVILVVAVAVILAATVTVLALDLVEEEDPQPSGAFDWDPYNANHGVITWTYVSGQNLEAERFVDKGGAVDLANTDFTISAGQTGFVFARPDDTVRFVEDEGETRHVITEHEMPDNRPLKPVNWSASGQNSLQTFRSNFYRHPLADELEWEGRSDHVRVTTNQSSNSWMLYSTTIAENSGNVTVEMRFETESFQDSGYKFYLFDQSSDIHEVWCDGSSGGGDVQINCNQGTPSINGTASRTLTTNEEFGALLLVVDMEDPPNRNEVAKFYNLTVKTN